MLSVAFVEAHTSVVDVEKSDDIKVGPRGLNIPRTVAFCEPPPRRGIAPPRGEPPPTCRGHSLEKFRVTPASHSLFVAATC